ncbi:MAG TPA: hypothetical protein VFI91_04540 [Longimicrobiaceae bacterium]|nr:hypothetical protein [Longimicrobiaceae bacterium]
MLHVARFLQSYFRDDSASPMTEEVEIAVDGTTVPATLIQTSARRAPAWVVLHGITVPGRQHPTLLRFSHALAAAGGTVLIPEVPAWRELRIDPAAAGATIKSAAQFLRDELPEERVGVIGFSFGATQALVTAADSASHDLIDTVVGFGGYCDLERTLIFMMTGEHEWKGTSRKADPDPYGRWIVAANYLTDIPEFSGMTAVADGAVALATKVGQAGTFAGDPMYDELKLEVRKTLSTAEREVWDLIAPPAGAAVPPEAARALAKQLVAAALDRHPDLDPRPALGGVRQRVVLAHGFEDRLIPFTETLRLQKELPATVESSVTITRLFAHSTGGDALRSWQYPGEALRYVRLLVRALRRRPGSR